jgi:hypothetical protein
MMIGAYSDAPVCAEGQAPQEEGRRIRGVQAFRGLHPRRAVAHAVAMIG